MAIDAVIQLSSIIPNIELLVLQTFSSINYMSDRTSSTCSKCRPSDWVFFVCLTPQGLLMILAYRGGGVIMKDQIQTQTCNSEILVHDANLSPKNIGAKFCFQDQDTISTCSKCSTQTQK